MLRLRVREAGDAALVAELPARIDPMTNGAVLCLADRIRSAGLKGIRDVVPGIRSLAVFYDPLHADVDALTHLIASKPLEPDIVREGRRHAVPVVYGGSVGLDLEEVAAASRLTREQLVERHAGRDYRVYMLGFLPGFAYLGTLDSTIVAARRPTPRLHVPAGAVGVAGRQTGIYPRESPGGWALLGHTPVRMFDPGRAAPSLLSAGDVVRFVPVEAESRGSQAVTDIREPASSPLASSAALEIRRPGLMTTVQDGGRWGHQLDGVSVAGALDRVSHRMANALVGNESSAATLEATIAGPEVVCLDEAVVAIAGADLNARVAGQLLPRHHAMKLPAGSVLSFGERREGARAYIAFAGGIDVPLVLGSRATHLGSGLGGVSGRALRAGDRLSLLPRGPLNPRPLPHMGLRSPSGGARLRVLPGPQGDSFPPAALRQLTQTRFTVSADSNRMGYRLSGPALPVPEGEMISDVTFPGAVQVPASGRPILLMADRQTTGGYPQLAIVISADVCRAGQLAPGDWVEFELTTRATALAALHEQERAMQHLEGHAFA